MDMKISGSGRIAAGEYEDISVNGAARLGTPIRCRSFHCAGSAHSIGRLNAQQEIRIAGSAQFDGNTSAQDIRISGSASIYGNCTSTGEMRVSGSLRCSGSVKGNIIHILGAVHTDRIEGEDVLINGKLTCPDLLNARNIVLKMNGATSKVGSIGGSSITIYPERYHKIVAHLPLLPKLLRGWGYGDLTVKEVIEGDEIKLEMVTAKSVIGRSVTIGAGCHIEYVRYTDSLEISPDAKVEHIEQI